MGEVKPSHVPEAGAAIAAPVPLTASHDVSGFDCGRQPLNEWLRKRALKNQLNNGSNTYVVCHSNSVIGFYALAAGNILHDAATGKVKRNMPDPIPVMVLGRLGVDRRWAGQGIGSGMLRESMLRTVQVSEIIGVRALLAHAKDEEAKRFYISKGFSASPIEPMTLMVTVQEIAASL